MQDMKLTILCRHPIDIYRLAQIYAALVDVEIKSFETSLEGSKWRRFSATKGYRSQWLIVS